MPSAGLKRNETPGMGEDSIGGMDVVDANNIFSFGGIS